jgi:hypothetical protein
MLQVVARQNVDDYYSSIDSNDMAKEGYLKVNKKEDEFGSEYDCLQKQVQQFKN